MSEEVIERVPPPPPPGFGDEEYYRLYGRPEEYHKYRQKLAQSLRMNRKSLRPSPAAPLRLADATSASFTPSLAPKSPRCVKGPPFNSYEEEYEHFYGRKNREQKTKKPHSEEETEEEEGTPELSSSSEEEEEEGDEISVEELSDDGSEGEVFDSEEEGPIRKESKGREKKFENFRVTRVLLESSEGTPSLSEEEGGGRHLSPMRHGRGKSIKDRLGQRPPSPPPSTLPKRRRRQSPSSPVHKKTRRLAEPNRKRDIRQRKSPEKERDASSLSRRRARRHVSPPPTSGRKSSSGVRNNGAPSRRKPSPRRSSSRRRKEVPSRENGHRNGRRPSPSAKIARLARTSRGKDGRRRRSPPLRGMESETHRRAARLLTRSPEERKTHPRGKERTAKWQHDKFRDVSGSPIDVEEDIKKLEGSHWKQIRSERSKERDRNGTQGSRRRKRRRNGGSKRNSSSSRSSSSRSRSSGSRSRSYSRSSSGRSMSSFSSSSSRSSSSSSSRSSLDSYLRSRRKPRRHPRRSSSPRQNNNNNNHKQSVKSTAHEDRLCTGKTSGSPPDENLVDESEQPIYTNTPGEDGVKYSEPPDYRRPRTKWRLYVFKGNEELPILYIHRQSSYLLGRDRKVADVPLDHPSCSKQHAVLQYRLVKFTRQDGSRGKRVVPYVIDLNSANGTFINNKKIEPQKFLQVLEKDVLKFGFSSREYVLLHDQTNDAENEDLGLDS